MTDDRESPAGSLLVDATPWEGTSADPNDEQFGDVVDIASLEDADAFDLVLVGEPYDGAVIGRTGAREGPAAIRAELAGLKTNYFGVGPVAGAAGGDPDASTGGDVATEPDASTIPNTTTDSADAAPVPTIADLGDVAIGTAAPSANATTAAVQDRVATFTEAVHASSATPVFLGGDNSLTVGNVRPLVDAAHEAGERVGVVNFDAHLDVREPADGPTSGTPYRQLLEAGLDRYLVVGARHFETTTAYAEYVEEHGGDEEVDSIIVTADEVASDRDAVRTRIASATADLDRVFVSVDVDVLDAAVAPGASAPTPGGLQARELFSLVRTLGSDRRVAGFELVETAPSLDPAAVPDSPARNRTVAAAARTVAHFVAGYAQRGTE